MSSSAILSAAAASPTDNTPRATAMLNNATYSALAEVAPTPQLIGTNDVNLVHPEFLLALGAFEAESNEWGPDI